MFSVSGFSGKAILAAVLLARWCSAVPQAYNSLAKRAGPGDVILVGGELAVTNTEVWQRIIQAGGGSSSRFGVLTAGSIPKSQDPDANDPDKCSNSECNGAYYADILKKNGAGSAEWIPIDLDHQSAAEDSKLADTVSRYTGFFIGGGDQTRYSDILIRTDGKTDTTVLAAMRAAIKAGAGVAGSSAGSAIQQAGAMVTGGESYYGVRDGSHAGSSSDNNALTYRAEGGFGFFSAGLVDTHFGVRGREGRFIRLLADTHNTLGFGLDEDTAIVASGSTFTALGTNNVHVLNTKDAVVGSDRDWSIRTVRWTALGSGDAIDAVSGAVTRAPGSSAVSGASKTVKRSTATDVFSSPDNLDSNNARLNPYEMVNLAQDLINAGSSKTTSEETYESSPAYRVTLSLGASYGAWEVSGADKARFQDIVVDIESV